MKILIFVLAIFVSVSKEETCKPCTALIKKAPEMSFVRSYPETGADSATVSNITDVALLKYSYSETNTVVFNFCTGGWCECRCFYNCPEEMKFLEGSTIRKSSNSHIARQRSSLASPKKYHSDIGNRFILYTNSSCCISKVFQDLADRLMPDFVLGYTMSWPLNCRLNATDANFFQVCEIDNVLEISDHPNRAYSSSCCEKILDILNTVKRVLEDFGCEPQFSMMEAEMSRSDSNQIWVFQRYYRREGRLIGCTVFTASRD